MKTVFYIELSSSNVVAIPLFLRIVDAFRNNLTLEGPSDLQVGEHVAGVPKEGSWECLESIISPPPRLRCVVPTVPDESFWLVRLSVYDLTAACVDGFRAPETRKP
jgi:hypothetical protein